MSKTKRVKKLLSRRNILKGGGTVLGAAAIGAGGFLVYDHRKRFGRKAEMTIGDHRVGSSDLFPKMVVARGADPSRSVRAAIDRLGGMGRFVGPEDVVVIKPNVGWDRVPAQAANTHPEVVAEVVRCCVDVRPKEIIVCDCPVSDSKKAFELSGIMKASLEAGAEVILPEEKLYRTVPISKRLGTWDVLDPFVRATKLINIPVAKHHGLTGVTAGMKNWIGITGKLRLSFHGDIQKSIAELAALMKPTLTVMDATRVLMESGPHGGNVNDVRQLGTVAAGTDPVALDAFAFSLFGVTPRELPEYIRLVEQMGLGVADFSSIPSVEIVL